MKNNKKTSANSALGIKISIITVIVIIWIICLAFMVTRCENNAETSNLHPDTVTEETDKITNPYASVENGMVKKEDSKTVAYFNSHFKDSYRNVVEVYTDTIQDGENCMTIERAYSTDGYLYEKTTPASYIESKDYDNQIIKISTPNESYTLYANQKVYFKYDTTTKGYKNTIDFPGEEFKTGTINVFGIDFYYEEMPVENGITVRYCFDKEGNLRHRISTSQKGSATETYYEYSKDVDPSIFEIPADYTLQQ